MVIIFTYGRTTTLNTLHEVTFLFGFPDVYEKAPCENKNIANNFNSICINEITRDNNDVMGFILKWITYA